MPSNIMEMSRDPNEQFKTKQMTSVLPNSHYLDIFW